MEKQLEDYTREELLAAAAKAGVKVIGNWRDETIINKIREADAADAADAPDAADAADAAPAPEINPLARGAVGLAAHRYQNHSAVVPAADQDSILASKYWSNNAAGLNPGDEIRVLASDYSWRALLLVTYKSGDTVGVTLLDLKELDTEVDIPAAADDRYKVMPATTGAGFVVRDMDTGAQIGGGFPTRSKAERQREDHIRALSL